MMDSNLLVTPGWLSAGTLRPLVLGWIICFLLLPQLGLGQAGRDEVLEGNSLFAEGRFDEAHEKYQQALDEDPSSAAIRYNLGDAEYKKSLYEEAIEAFSQAAQTEDPELQARASYNLGNALYRLGKLEDSIQAYQNALRINPEDRDSKHNLEFVRSKLEEQEQQKEKRQEKQDKQEDQDKQGDQDQKDQDQSQNEERDQNQDQEGKQEQDDPQEQASDQDQQKQQKDQGKEQPEQQQQDSGSEEADSRSIPKMSREEAERLLEALNERDNELKKKKLRTKGTVPVEKDW